MSAPKWKTYRPSNGTMGDEFMDIVCSKCKNPTDQCPILTASFWNDIEDPEYPTEMQVKWTAGEGYDIRCTARVPSGPREEVEYK